MKKMILQKSLQSSRMKEILVVSLQEVLGKSPHVSLK